MAELELFVVVRAQCICGKHLGAAAALSACVFEVATCTHIHSSNRRCCPNLPPLPPTPPRADPLYFDFISFSQFSTISNEMGRPLKVFSEYKEVCPPGAGEDDPCEGGSQLVQRPAAFDDDTQLPTYFFNTAGATHTATQPHTQQQCIQLYTHAGSS